MSPVEKVARSQYIYIQKKCVERKCLILSIYYSIYGLLSNASKPGPLKQKTHEKRYKNKNYKQETSNYKIKCYKT